MVLAREYKREPEFMSAWESRIGQEAAVLRYRSERSDFWYPYPAIAACAFFILGLAIESWFVFGLAPVALIYSVYLCVISWRYRAAAQRAADVHFGMPPGQKPGVPIMRVKIFDRWLRLHNSESEKGAS
jgi:hypothetical protein